MQNSVGYVSWDDISRRIAEYDDKTSQVQNEITKKEKKYHEFA